MLLDFRLVRVPTDWTIQSVSEYLTYLIIISTNVALVCKSVQVYRIKLDRWTNFWKRDTVTFLIRSTLWPKSRNVTPWHSFKGQLHGPKRNDKLFKNINKVQKRLPNSNKVNFTAKIRKRDSVTFITRSTLWPRIYIAWRVTALNPIKHKPFFSWKWCDRAIGLIYYGRSLSVKFGRPGFALSPLESEPSKITIHAHEKDVFKKP